MNWTRYKTLIVTGGITVVVSGVLIFWILSSRSAAADLDRDIQQQRSTQSRLVASDPYPSSRNVEQLRAEQEKVRERRDTLKRTILEGQISVPPARSPSGFVDYLRNELVPRLQRAANEATKGGEAGVVLRDPVFGLQRYFEGELPEARQVPDLMVKLETIAHISETLFEAGISELVAIQAVEPKTDDRDRPRAGGPAGFGVFGAPSPPAVAAGTPEPGSEVKQEKARLFEAVEYRIEFRAYEDFFWEVLNNLLADPNQIVIKRVSVTNSNELLWPDYLKPTLAGAGRAETRRPTRPREMNALERELMRLEGRGPAGGGTPADSEAAKTVLPGLTKRRQMATGGSLLNVVMDVVVYRLKAETPETTEGS